MKSRRPSALSRTASLLRTGVALTLCPLVTACVTSRVEEYMTSRPVLNADDSVVILANRQDAVVETETDFSECLYSELAESGTTVNIISEADFKDRLFPWFEPRLAPTRPEGMSRLMANPRINDRMGELRVRYLVWIHGESEALNKQGTMTCTISPAGAGCLGVLSWDNNSDYEASIWDLASGESLGVISSEATGTSVIPAIGVPIPLIARTKTASCKGLADQLRGVLTATAQ